MKFYYLIHLQFLGFRYHGWQKQSAFKTIQETIEKGLKTFLGETPFKTLGASRTDSMVSAQNTFFELLSEVEIEVDSFPHEFNKLLPPDVKILKCEVVDRHFRMISAPKLKEYLYFFSYGEKNHPFAAPFITHINEELDLELMKAAAQLFTGTHHFKNYCYRPSENQIFSREIMVSEIKFNDILSANFFPAQSYYYRVQARSFMRHQVRLMMGILFRIGMKQVTLEEVNNSLFEQGGHLPLMIAPASGLMLNQITLT